MKQFALLCVLVLSAVAQSSLKPTSSVDTIAEGNSKAPDDQAPRRDPAATDFLAQSITALGGLREIASIKTIHVRAELNGASDVAGVVDIDFDLRHDRVLFRREINGSRGREVVVSGEHGRAAIKSDRLKTVSPSVAWEPQPYLPPVVILARALSDPQYSLFPLVRNAETNECSIELALNRSPALAILTRQIWVFDCESHLPQSVSYRLAQNSRRTPLITATLAFSQYANAPVGMSPRQLTSDVGGHRSTALIKQIEINSGRAVSFDEVLQ